MSTTPTTSPETDRRLGDSYLSETQVSHLLGPINPQRVARANGQSHVEAYEIRAHLNRIFGIARWDEQVIDQQLVYEERIEPGTLKPNDPHVRWSVLYRTLVRLDVRAPDGTHLATYTEGATGEAINQPHRHEAHDLALKTSQSQALKRCAVNLGDQFGLSLYRKGSTAQLVQGTLVGTRAPIAQEALQRAGALPLADQDIWLLVRRPETNLEELRALWKEIKAKAGLDDVLDPSSGATVREVLTGRMAALAEANPRGAADADQ